MKIVNEKGKLFGIINLVDLLILIAVILIVGTGVWQLAGNKVTDAVAQEEELTAIVVVAGAHPDLVEEVERQGLVGEQLVNGNAYVNGYIADVWMEEYAEQHPDANGQLQTSVDPCKKSICFVIKSTVAANTPTPKIGSQEIRTGGTFIIKTQTFSCTGNVYYLQIGADEAAE